MKLSSRLASIGRHQRAIERLYAGRVRFEGTEPLFDTPLIVVAFTNRSGSHLLADMLIQSGRINGLGEFLNADVVANMREKFASESFPDHLAALRNSLCPQGQIFGVKASWDQLLMLLRWNIPAMFSGLKVIHITRNDRIAQAVSHSIAQQTQRWTSLQADTGRMPEFRPQEIARLMEQADEANQMIRLITLGRGIPCANAIYEALHHHAEDHMRHMFIFCGIDPARWQRRPARVKKQADATNADFIARMRAHLSAQIDAAPGVLDHLFRMKR